MLNWRNWKIVQWFRSKQALINENRDVLTMLATQQMVTQSINNALQFNINEAEKFRTQMIAILGGIALQHQGEVFVKDDLILMIVEPEYRLRVVMEYNKEKKGLFIRTVETPKEEQEPQETKTNE